MNKIKFVIALAAIAVIGACSAARAQVISINATNLSEAFQLLGLSQQLLNSQLIQVGRPFTLFTAGGNQSYLISTNPAGTYTITTSGPNGTNSFTPPNTLGGFVSSGEQILAENNPANASYYGTNEFETKIGVLYEQNSGRTVADIGVEYYGLFGQANIGVGAGILEGNNGGLQGTAGYFGNIDYRKPIGDVAWFGGAVFGYNNWDKEIFGGVHGGLEYRQNKHLGEFIEVAAVLESHQSDKPLLIGGGVTGSF